MKKEEETSKDPTNDDDHDAETRLGPYANSRSLLLKQTNNFLVTPPKNKFLKEPSWTQGTHEYEKFLAQTYSFK